MLTLLRYSEVCAVNEPEEMYGKEATMTERLFTQFEQHGPLTQVREGMDVYDRADRKVGTVKNVYMGNSSAMARDQGRAPATAGPSGDGDDSLLENLAEVFVPQDTLPHAFRERLLKEGYIAIDAAGLFAGDRFATPDQIMTVREDRVDLNVGEDGLIND